MASLSLRHIYKIYQGGVKAVSDFNLEIDDKEFVVFVGPSGCGKSTTLRMVAGLEEISAGELYIDGKLVNDVEPKDRDIAMVFQNYALYPHMTVYDNMAFGLRLRKMNSQEIDSRVQEAAAILGITPLLSRKPKALSGGQRQRVALGRAIVREPKVFLLDEPLSNLDAKLRVQMRTEITKLHNKLATTFIYVTHDQTEAMTMGTRIVVMKDGIVQQVDTPQCLYDFPDNLFVASFLGSPQMNFFKAVLSVENGVMYSTFGENKIVVPEAKAKRLMDKSYIGKEVVMGVRPEDIHDEEIFIASSPNSLINAEIDVIEKLGNETILYMKVDGKEDYTIARIDARCSAQANQVVKLAIDANHIHFFDPETELTIMGVPKVNRIPAILLAETDKLTVRFGNTKFDLPNSISEKITDINAINHEVSLEIAPAEFNVTPIANATEIPATVSFVEKYPRFTAAYCKVVGKDGYIVAKSAVDSEISPNDVVTFYVSPEAVQLRDLTTGEKLVAYKKVTNNTMNASVSVKDNVAAVSFGKNKIAMPTNQYVRESGEMIINIDPRGISVGKENVAKAPKMVVVGRIEDADVLGANTIVYATVDGIEGGLSAIVSGTVNYNVGDKVKFAIDPMAVTSGKLPSITEVIALKAEQAPEYKFVEVKPEVKKEIAKEEVKTDVKEDAMNEISATADEKASKTVKKVAEKKPAAKPAAKSTAAKPAAKKPTAKK